MKYNFKKIKWPAQSSPQINDGIRVEPVSCTAKSHVLSSTAQLPPGGQCTWTHEAASANVSPISSAGCKLSRIFTRDYPQSSPRISHAITENTKKPWIRISAATGLLWVVHKYLSLMHLSFVTSRSRIIIVTR